jgi:hypothetical protein
VEDGEITGGWRNLHSAELNDIYFSPNVIHTDQFRGLGGWQWRTLNLTLYRSARPDPRISIAHWWVWHIARMK